MVHLSDLAPMEFMEWAYGKFLNLTTIFIPIGTIMSIIYGVGVNIHHDDDECYVWHFDGGDRANSNVRENMDNTIAVFFAGISAIAIYMLFTLFDSPNDDPLERLWYWTRNVVFGFGGAVLVSTAVWQIQMGALTGFCTVTSPTGEYLDNKNGRVHDMPLYSGVVLTVLLCAAFHRVGPTTHLLNPWAMPSTVTVKTSKSAYEILEGIVGSVTRIVFSWLLFRMFTRSNSTFFSSYVIPTTSACTTALGKLSIDTKDARTFENVEVGHYVNGTWNTNDNLVRLTYALVVFSTLEMIVRLIEIYVSFANGKKPKWIGSMVVDGIVRVLGLTSDVILSVFVFVFLKENEVAACGVLDPSHWDVRVIYRMTAWFIVQVYLVYWLRTEYGKMVRQTTIGDAWAGLFVKSSDGYGSAVPKKNVSNPTYSTVTTNPTYA